MWNFLAKVSLFLSYLVHEDSLYSIPYIQTLKAKPFDVTIISANAATNDHDALRPRVFYNTLCMTIHGIPKRHFMMIGIDANAKLGCNLSSNQRIGHFTTVSLCDKGAMLICSFNNH
jgi:hypothetical protein